MTGLVSKSGRAWIAGLVLSAAMSTAPAYAAAARPAPARGFNQHIEGVDLQGVWNLENFIASANPTEKKIMKTIEGEDIPFQPWSKAIYDKRLDDDRAGRGFANTPAYCLPGGMPQMMTSPWLWALFQTPGQITTIHEEMHLFRQIFLNKPHDPDPNPGYMGDSVGHWEGDTLVVDTVGRNDKTTIDMLGLPHTDALHVVERMRRLSHEQLEIVFTVDDSKAFTRPWRFRKTYRLQDPDTHVSEYICADGQRNQPDPVTGRPTFPGAGPERQ